MEIYFFFGELTLSRNLSRLFSKITRCFVLFRVYSYKFRLNFKYIRVITRYFAKATRYFAIPRNLFFTYENELNIY